MEGFQDGGAASAGNFFGEYYPRRTDVIPGQTVEDGGWVRDLRYKEEYVDVQRVGFKNDLCRVVMRRGDPGSMIMACALAGGDGTPSRGYKTRSKAEGFKFSRDDYFREVNGDLRDDYCRIVKTAMSQTMRGKHSVHQRNLPVLAQKRSTIVNHRPRLLICSGSMRA